MKKILLIEDEASVVEFIKKGLTEENFEVTVALNGNSAIAMATDYIFDLFILDILLFEENLTIWFIGFIFNLFFLL